MNISEAIEAFTRARSIKSERTARSYMTGIKRFLTYLKELDILLDTDTQTLTMKHIRDFASWLFHDYRTPVGRKLSPAALDLYLTAILRFYDFLIVNDAIDSGNYVKTHKFIRELVPREEIPMDTKLPPDEVVQAVIEAITQLPEREMGIPDHIWERQYLVWLRNRAIVLCMESSGARVGELSSLERRDLQYEDRGAWVRKAKGHKMRFIRFSSRAWQALMEYLDAREDKGSLERIPLFCRHDRGAGKRQYALTPLSIERLIKRLLQDTGMDKKFNLTPHSLRHYFATRFLRATGNLALTQDALGHSSPTMTRVYAKTTKADLIKAHEQLFE